MSAEPSELRSTERWFIRRGLPMFVEDYSAGRDVWTRALPALALLFVGNILLNAGAIADVADLLVFSACVVVAVLVYGWWNRRRGRRAMALPDRVTPPWLVAFVVVPAVVDVAVSHDPLDLLGGLVAGGLVLGLVYVVTRYALVSLLVWTVRWTFGRLGEVTRLITRVLPLLLLFITFLFINTEVWQVAGTMSAPVLWGSLAVFGVLGVLFIVGRAREEFDRIELSTDRASVVAACDGTPIERQVADLHGLERPVPMRRAQRANLVLVMVTAQSVQVALVGVVVWAFFVIFGSVAISVPVQEAWLGSLSDVTVLVPLGDGHGVTRQLLRVATFLGGFSGFYATVYAASDTVYRAQFAERISADLERALAVRRAYVALRRRAGLGQPVGPTPAP